VCIREGPQWTGAQDGHIAAAAFLEKWRAAAASSANREQRRQCSSSAYLQPTTSQCELLPLRPSNFHHHSLLAQLDTPELISQPIYNHATLIFDLFDPESQSHPGCPSILMCIKFSLNVFELS